MVVPDIPTQATPFVGRDEELARISALLADPACRLLTLLGPGGIGKTRLALEVARRETERNAREVRFASLKPISSPDHIVLAIAEAIGFPFAGAEDAKQQLFNHLENKRALLILDNFEHLLDGAALVSEILSRSPHLIILVTSRERLNLLEEWVFEVGGLQVPADDTQMSINGYSAVQLFVQSATRVRPTFSPQDEWASVIEICRLVEGMPLGIELAASWVRTLSCREIADEIGRGLDILTTSARNMPPQHRNMRAVLNYSWDLLSDDERAVFSRLSVFRGGFTRDAAQNVADASLLTLEALIDKSWLRHDPGSQRYDIHELLRQYGEERLNEDPEAAHKAYDRHCTYYVRLLEQSWLRLIGSEYKAAYNAIEAEVENIRASWNWAVRNNREDDFHCAFKSLWLFYDSGNRFQEGEQTFADAASELRAAGKDNSVIYGRVLAYQGALLYSLDRISESKARLEESLEIVQRLEDPDVMAFDLLEYGMAILFESDNYDLARSYVEQSLAIYRDLEDQWGIAYSLQWLSIIYVYAADIQDFEHNMQQASPYAEESLAIFQQMGSQWGIASLGNHLGIHALSLSEHFNSPAELERGKRFAEESLRIYQETGIQWGMALSYWILSWAAELSGDPDEARRFVYEGLSIVLKYRLWRHAYYLLSEVAEIYLRQGETERTYGVLAMMEQQRRKLGQAKDNWSLATKIDLDGDLPPNLRAAVVRGRTRDFETALREVVQHLSVPFSNGKPPVPHPEPLDALSERELEILRLVAEGMSNQQIADHMVIALGTVKTHVHNIYGKLGVESRTQAIARARELNLI